MEAGIKGFWYQYWNIFALLRELDLPEWPLTGESISAPVPGQPAEELDWAPLAPQTGPRAACGIPGD